MKFFINLYIAASGSPLPAPGTYYLLIKLTQLFLYIFLSNSLVAKLIKSEKSDV